MCLFNWLLRLRSKKMFSNKHTLHCRKRHDACYTNNWLRAINTKEQHQRTDLLEWQESNAATGHGELKFPYHTNKMFTFKLRVVYFWDIPYKVTDSTLPTSLILSFILRMSLEVPVSILRPEIREMLRTPASYSICLRSRVWNSARNLTVLT
jgi:hypothetical protein